MQLRRLATLLVATLSIAGRAEADEEMAHARLNIQWDDKVSNTYSGDQSSGSATTHRSIEMAAEFDVPKRDYKGTSGGKPGSFIFSYTEAGTGTVTPTSFSGTASYSYESQGEAKSGPTESQSSSAHAEGSGQLKPGSGSFVVHVQGDKITVHAVSGSFDVTRQSTSGKTSHSFTQKMKLSTRDFSLNGESNPNWKIEIHPTDDGWSGTATYHTRTSHAGSFKNDTEETDTLHFTFELASRKFEVKYDRTDIDVGPLEWSGTPVDRHVLKESEDSWMGHANFRGSALVDGRDQVQLISGPESKKPHVSSGEYMIDRILRASNPDGSHPEPWLWFNDPSTTMGVGRRTVEADDWLDLPGGYTENTPPNRWRSGGQVDEFLVTVKGHPEFGWVYIAFIMELRGPRSTLPNPTPQYRIRYSLPERITDADKYKEIVKSKAVHAQGLYFSSADEGWVDLIEDPKAPTGWKTIAPAP